MRAYLDHAATTPMRASARAAWLDASHTVGNASSLHTQGRGARRLVEEARERVAGALGVRPSEVVFTAGGTESDNAAIKGAFWASPRTSIAVSTIEHHAVLDAVDWLRDAQGARVLDLPVDAFGRVRCDVAEEVFAQHGSDCAIVSIMWANNEVGTIQPMGELSELARRYGIVMHSDAVQAVGSIPVDPNLVDLFTVSGHKLGAPVGTGCLIIGRDITVAPVLHGGGQERDVRSGTLDVAGIHAFSIALDEAVAEQPAHALRVSALRDDLVRRVQAAVPTSVYNGAIEDRLPGNAHFTFPGCEGDDVLMLLDAAGVDVSTGSACSAGIPEPSHVLLAMGASPQAARGSLRFSLGATSSDRDVDALVAALPGVIARARREA